MPLIEKQRNVVKFTLASLLRRKRKNVTLIAVYTLVIFMLGSVMFFTSSIEKEASSVLKEAPEMMVQKLVAGRHEYIPVNYVETIKRIKGVQSVKPRLWGYYHNPENSASYTLVVDDSTSGSTGEITVGRGVAKNLAGSENGSISFKTWDGSSYQPGRATFAPSVITNLFEDEGYFASLDALKRIKVASHTFDLGEYLGGLHSAGNLKTDFGPVPGKMAYYPPCHLREQKIGQPYAELMSLVPEMSLEPIDGAFHCCGIAGIMGFKSDFYQVSVKMGEHLMQKITSINPDRLVTDCLSCRIQFNQLIPYRVFHPVEILCESYANYDHRRQAKEYG